MMNGLFSAVSGGVAQEIWLDKVTNNLANLNTAGFKGDYPTFESELVESSSRLSDMEGPSAPVVLVKARNGLDLSQGALKRTGNPLDIAIEGEGYLVVNTPEGERYTRGGSFVIDSEGTLSTSEGHPLKGKDGDLKITGSPVTIANNGDLFVNERKIGSLSLVKFDDENVLSKSGNSLYQITGNGKPIDVDKGNIFQGHIEMSNVMAVTEMTRLINISRAYEAYQKVVSYMNDVHSKVINEVGRPS